MAQLFCSKDHHANTNATPHFCPVGSYLTLLLTTDFAVLNDGSDGAEARLDLRRDQSADGERGERGTLCFRKLSQLKCISRDLASIHLFLVVLLILCGGAAKVEPDRGPRRRRLPAAGAARVGRRGGRPTRGRIRRGRRRREARAAKAKVRIAARRHRPGNRLFVWSKLWVAR